MEENLNKIYDVFIIGGGPAGATAAIYAARAGLKTAVLDKGVSTGALGITDKIANYPGLDREVSGAELLGIMRKQAQGYGAEFINDKAIGTDLSAEIKMIYGNLDIYQTRSLIIATGSMGRKNLIEGEAAFLGRGVSYCAVCDAAFYRNKVVAVIGKNDEALEEALYLSRFAKKVHLLVPGTKIEAPEAEKEALEAADNIKIHYDVHIREIKGNDKVDAVTWINSSDKSSLEELAVQGVFVYLQGGAPITDFLKGQLEFCETGCLQVDRDMQTAIPGVFAVGDVLCTQIRQAVIAAGDGAIAAIAAEKWLRGKSKSRLDWH